MMTYKPYLFFISLIAMMGGLMFGFEIAIISGAVPFIQTYFDWTELQLGWGVASLLVGAVLGSISSGYLSDRFGRKRTLIFVSLFFALSCFGVATAESSLMFIIARIVGGLSVGAASVISPMYVAEVAPRKIRGSLVAVYQLTITLGILISYLINYSLHDVENNWRWMFATGVVPSVLFFIGLFFIPESPRWLVLKGKKGEALKVLGKISNDDVIDSVISEIESSLHQTKEKTNYASLFKGAYRAPVVLGLMLAVLIQITGINTVIDYAPKILLAAGLEIKSALLQTSIIGLLNFVATFVAIWFIEKAGRRVLYLIGSAAMFVSLILLSLSFYFELDGIFALLSLLLFIASFAAFIGPVFWTLVSEIFPNRIRGKAIALASFTQWVFNFIIVLFFPHLLKSIGGSATFALLAVMCLAQFWVAFRWLPETKGKSLEEIEKLWVIG
ncbi:MAG: sugar porter family MFS transporter [Bacteroidota bacterium]